MSPDAEMLLDGSMIADPQLSGIGVLEILIGWNMVTLVSHVQWLVGSIQQPSAWTCIV